MKELDNKKSSAAGQSIAEQETIFIKLLFYSIITRNCMKLNSLELIYET